MEKKLILLLTLFTAACSSRPSSKGGFKLVMGRAALEVALQGGAYVDALDKTTGKSTLLKLDAENSATIAFGSYQLLFVAFAGPEANSGALSCGMVENATFDTPEASMTINMNAANCLLPAFANTILTLKKSTISKWDSDRWDLSHWGP